MDIAKYYVSLGLSPTKAFMEDVDRTLKALEEKLSTLRMGTGLFKVDQKKLEISLGNALDIASKKLVFEISHFKVDKAAFQRAMSVASSVGVGHVSSGANRAAMQSHYRNTYVTTRSLSPTEWNRREGVKNEEWNRRREELRADQRARLEARRPRVSSNLSSIGAGGAAGLASRLYAPAIAIAGGAYGINALNERNQQVVSAKLQTQAVQQSYGGTKEQGQEAFKWLQSEGNRIGFNWLEAAPEFNVLASNLQGSGSSLEDAKTVFKGFSEYGRVNKLSNARQNLVFNALSQVAGKDKLQAEELTKQLGNSLPGAKSLFAEAYQRKLGTRLTGSEAIIKLEGDMKKGLVRGDILKYAAQVASERAQPGLAAASKASQAEQNRYKNALNEQVSNASDAGVESGYARLFRAFTAAMIESTPAVEGLAKGFDTLSKYVSFAVLLPQSITRAFEGRDSWVADAMGAANVKIAKDLFAGLSSLGEEIKTTLGLAFDGWGLIFEEFGAPLMGFLQTIKDVFLYTFKMLNFAISGDKKGVENSAAAMRASMSGMSAKDVEAIANGTYVAPIKTQDQGLAEYKAAVVRRDAILNTPANGVIETATQAGLLTRANWDVAHLQKYADSDSQNKARERNDFELSRAIALADDSKRFQQQAADSAKLNTTGVMPLPATSKQTLEVIIKAEDIKGADHNSLAAKISDGVKTYVETMFTHAMIANPTKE